MDYAEKWGTDVDTAVKLALADLKLTIDEVDVTVLEEPSRGFFGIGSKLALVRVEKKKAKPVVQEKNREAEIPAAVSEAMPAQEVCAPEEKTEEKQDVLQTPSKQNKQRRERNNRSRRGTRARSERELKAFKIPEEPVIARVPESELTPCEDHVALRFLKEVTEEMGLELEITAKTGEDVLYIDIAGKDSGTIIGKRGQTLDAITYLTSLVVNKDENNYIRVVVDAENYRAKREKTLEMLAVRLANKAVRTHRSVKLEPMNPYERKVIHATLQSHPYVTTRSEGQDPYRRVIIELK